MQFDYKIKKNLSQIYTQTIVIKNIVIYNLLINKIIKIRYSFFQGVALNIISLFYLC